MKVIGQALLLSVVAKLHFMMTNAHRLGPPPRQVFSGSAASANGRRSRARRWLGGWPTTKPGQPATYPPAVVIILASELFLEMALFVEDYEQVETGAHDKRIENQSCGLE